MGEALQGVQKVPYVPCLKNPLESGPINFSYAPRDPEIHFKKHRLKGP